MYVCILWGIPHEGSWMKSLTFLPLVPSSRPSPSPSPSTSTSTPCPAMPCPAQECIGFKMAREAHGQCQPSPMGAYMRKSSFGRLAPCYRQWTKEGEEEDSRCRSAGCPFGNGLLLGAISNSRIRSYMIVRKWISLIA